ncbi:hypothetical protein GCM10027590_60510 [Nocardiopsis nanhaiensis]
MCQGCVRPRACVLSKEHVRVWHNEESTNGGWAGPLTCPPPTSCLDGFHNPTWAACQAPNTVIREKTTPVAVKLKLKRMGKIRTPQYRVIVADARNKRDGKAIEEIGKYHPKEHPSFIEVNSERVQYWLSVGAQPSDAVKVLLRKTGDWQKFKGLAAPAPLQVAEEKDPEAQEAAFQAALKELVLPGQEKKAKKSEKKTDKDKAEKAADKPAENAEAEKKSEGEA